MNVELLGLATAVAQHSISQDQAMEFALARCCDRPSQKRLVQTLYRRSGVSKRSSVLLENDDDDTALSFYPLRTSPDDRGLDTQTRMESYISHALPLARRAASEALEQSNIDPQKITHLITCSCTGFSAPGLEVRLLNALGLPATVSRTHIGFMGCHASFNAMAVARSFIMAQPDARVLVCSAELCSLHFAYGFDTQRMVANALFADGAAAAVLGASDQDQSHEAWQLAQTGSCILPDSTDAMTWNIGNHGFVMTLSSRVPDLIAAHLRSWLEPWLAQQGLALSDIGSWAIHPGGPRIVESTEAALGLPDGIAKVSRQVLSDYGNMSSATILFILKQLRDAGAARPCVALGFGPGLAAEVMLWR